MSTADLPSVVELPLPVAILVGLMLVFGSALTLLGTVGALILNSFYDRVHPPTLGATLGAALIIGASMIYFSVTEARLVVQEVVLLIFLFITSPVTLLLIVRASLHRDRVEGRSPVPEFDALEDEPPPEREIR